MKRPSKTSKKADKKAKPKTGEKREESPLLQLATTSSSSNTATTDSSPEVKSGSPMFGPLHSTPTLVIYRGSPFHGYAYPFIVSNQTALTILRPEVGTSPLPESDDENAVGKLEKSLIESGRKKDAKKKVKKSSSFARDLYNNPFIRTTPDCFANSASAVHADSTGIFKQNLGAIPKIPKTAKPVVIIEDGKITEELKCLADGRSLLKERISELNPDSPSPFVPVNPNFTYDDNHFVDPVSPATPGQS